MWTAQRIGAWLSGVGMGIMGIMTSLIASIHATWVWPLAIVLAIGGGALALADRIAWLRRILAPRLRGDPVAAYWLGETGKPPCLSVLLPLPGNKLIRIDGHVVLVPSGLRLEFDPASLSVPDANGRLRVGLEWPLSGPTLDAFRSRSQGVEIEGSVVTDRGVVDIAKQRIYPDEGHCWRSVAHD